MNNFSLWILLFFILLNCKNDESKGVLKKDVHPMFKMLSPQETGIYFQNTLTEGPNTNVLMYEYFFNGGGVAAGDLNGDGLTDLYFISNMGENKLYLNKGKLRFEDKTNASGATGRKGPWKTGVNLVDINGDQKLDIYVCYSGALPDAKRTNQLYINQGNDADNCPLFLEKAAEYGLASAAYSNQAYFFDYDRDGDLDMLLLNHNPKSIPVLDEKNTAEFMKEDNPFIGVRLLQQNHHHFEDVTLTAGVSGSALTYGLGIAISDVNNDGWPDFYVSNDYSVPDYLYINNQDGTFSDKTGDFLSHISLTSMGNDIADINNDGFMDIVTMDMLPKDNKRQKLLMSANNDEKFDLNVRSGLHKQYMRNMLQINNGNGTFSEVGQLAGISNTDWSWAALLADFDNDGHKDLYVTNGYYRDYTNLDFIDYMNNFVKDKRGLSRKDVLALNDKIPLSTLTNYMFLNGGNLTFQDVTSSWALDQPSSSNGAAYADLDNDGDLDLVVNNINQTTFVYENQADIITNHNFLEILLVGDGLNSQGLGAKIKIVTNGKKQFVEQSPGRGFLSSVSPVLHFGLGNRTKIDTLEITWPGGHSQVLTNIPTNHRITLKESDAKSTLPSTQPGKPVFEEIATPIHYQNPSLTRSDFDRQPLLVAEQSFTGPCMAKGDFNNDGVDDIFVGGAKGQTSSLYLGEKDGAFVKLKVPLFETDRESEDAAAIFFDANNDGNTDIYVASGGYHNYRAGDALLQDRLYLNKGNGTFQKNVDALPAMTTSKGCVVVFDINDDGFQDLFIGSRLIPGKYPETPKSFLLVNDGKGKFSDQIGKLAPALENFGMVTDALSLDINGDNQQDLVVVGEWCPVSVFINNKGKLENKTADYFSQEYKGWWNVIQTADFNKDQQPDLIVGNVGFNTQFRMANDEPAEMYFDDFDNDGTVDPVFCYFIGGKSYPYLTKDELMPNLRSRFPNYASYADAGLEEIFSSEQLQKAGHLIANVQGTSLFLSNDNGKFESHPLPIEVQFSPIYTINILDYDGDKNADVLLCGNNSHFKLRLGAVDANYGILLKGSGDGDFKYLDQRKSGLKLKGDVRSALQVDKGFLFGVNQGPLISYELTK